ncbi:hypothetical protein [Embleya sp. NBC_00896]|uniref:hypothetical protein n=1 Tax=Embleya sp. NBC_00896 TaxID=2975961 RepID=UPI003869C84C|nr:hypothetical protein OG928_07115 [Embleya sp. NBC_00896]
MSLRRPARLMAVVYLGLAGSLLVGCGGNGGEDDGNVATVGRSGSPTANTQADQGGNGRDRVLRFAACLREHGLDVPDPEPGVDGIALGGATDARTTTALKACEQFKPTGGTARADDRPDAEQQEADLKQARCLREQGLDVPDPQPGQPLTVPLAPGGDRARLDTAVAKCGGAAGAPQGAQPK